jgi:hypothetical protein
VKSSVSIALFFLLSGFFLTILLGAIEHSGKLLAIAGGCLAAVVCIIIFLTPVKWPAWHIGLGGGSNKAAITSTVSSTTSSAVSTTSTTLYLTVTTEALGAQPH